MANIIHLSKKKAIGEKEMTPFVVCRILQDAKMDADLRENEVVIVKCHAFDIIITVGADSSVCKIFYSARVNFRARLSVRDRLAAANGINEHFIGAAYVDGTELSIRSTLSFKGGILPHNIVNTIKSFQALLETALGKQEMIKVLE